MSDIFDQVPFAAEFADNPEPRCPCILLLDTSASMFGNPIQELNNGLVAFKDELMADSMASKRVEIAIVSFGPVRTVCDFTSPESFMPPQLSAGGDTPMGEAIERAITMVNERKNVYKQNGISYYRPWIFLVTDGAPTDIWASAANRIQIGEQNKSFLFFAIGVEGCNLEVMQRLSLRQPIKLRGLRFRDMFSWLSSSLSSVSRSSVGEPVPLENPVAPTGWGMVD